MSGLILVSFCGFSPFLPWFAQLDDEAREKAIGNIASGLMLLTVGCAVTGIGLRSVARTMEKDKS